MADDGTDTIQSAPEPDLSARIDQLYKQIMAGAPPAAPQNTGPSSREGRSFISLLGEGLGGGQQYGTTAERETGGFAALQALGARMLQASDYSYVPHSFGSILGQGLGAAQQQLGRQQAVSAARQDAAQQWQHQQQMEQLARVKEALPLLQLKQELDAAQRMRRLLSGGAASATPTPGASIATGGSIAPPDINSPAGEVAKRTAAFWAGQGLTPEQVAGVMAAGPGAESSFNPTAVGDAGASHGMYQHQGDRWAEMTKRYGPNPTEAQQHAFTAWEISPEGPRAAVGVQLRAAKTPEEAARIWTTGFEAPKNAEAEATKRASAAGRYVGYGQPPPGQATTPAMAPVGTQPPNAPVRIPPPVQVAGPGAGSPPVMPPDSGRPAEGAPDQTAASGTVPGAVVTAGAEPPTAAPPIPMAGGVITRHPGSFAEFSAREYVPPPKSEDFNPNLTPTQQAQFAAERQALEKKAAVVGAMVKPDPKAVADIVAGRDELQAKIQATIQAKQQAADAVTTKWNDAQRDKIQTRYEKQIDVYSAAAAAQQAQQNKLAEIETQARAARDTEAAKQEGQYILDDRKEFSKEREGARQAIDKVQVLRALSDRAGTATPLENITLPNGQTMRDLMVQTGMGTEESLKHLNAQQAYEAEATNMVMALRKGVPMGALSDRDLLFLQKLVPKGSVDPETRANILATVEQAYARKREYIDRVHQLWDQGHGMSWEKAKVEADKQMGDIVTQVPQAYRTMTPEERADWFKTNAPPRALIRTMDEMDKTGKVTRRGHIIQVPEPPR